MQKSRTEQPPEVMTWGKAFPVLGIAFVFDAVRFIFEMFWFFGPALTALYCTSKASEYVGVTVAGAFCSVAAGAAGFYGAPAIELFGVIMAMAVGLMGWLIIGAIMVMKNARIFKENFGNILWFSGSLMLSETPFIGALPTLTVTMTKMYATQIKKETAELKAYNEAREVEQLQERRQQEAEFQAYVNQQSQIAQFEEQEAVNEEEIIVQEEKAVDDEQYTQNTEKAA